MRRDRETRSHHGGLVKDAGQIPDKIRDFGDKFKGSVDEAVWCITLGLYFKK